MTTWWNAVSGGGFYTRWSAAASLLVAGIFSVPSVGGVGIEAYLRGAAVAVLGWAVLAALLVPVAVAERRLSSRAGRGALVLGGLLVVATMRSFVNDAISSALFGIIPSGPMPSRIATNLVTALALLSIVAVITSRHAASRAAAERLRTALARVASAEAQRQRVAAEARDALVSGIAALRRSRERMLDGPVDFEAVRAFSEDVRGLSHRVDRLLRSHDDGAATGALPHDADAPLSMRLVAPPWLSVAPLYALACFPYAVAAGGAGVGLAGLIGGILVDLVAGAAVRRWARPPRPAAFVAVWTAAGVGMSVVTYLFLPRIGVLGLVPVLAVPVVAVLVGLCRDALSRAGADERRAAGGLAEVAREAAEVDESAPVRRAIDVLHGRAQGACVVFAARVDERAPTLDEIADFRSRTEAAFREILHAGSDERMPPGESLDRLIEAWTPAVAVTQRIDDAVRLRLRDPETAERVASVVTDALVNAVKHSGARRAQVIARVTGSGSLLLRVASPGRLAPRPGRGLGTIGRRVFQDGGDVVLETVIPPPSL
ncbi:ATPase [Microbacterium arborescens]